MLINRKQTLREAGASLYGRGPTASPPSSEPHNSLSVAPSSTVPLQATPLSMSPELNQLQLTSPPRGRCSLHKNGDAIPFAIDRAS
jgi:hypothetical protein